MSAVKSGKKILKSADLAGQVSLQEKLAAPEAAPVSREQVAHELGAVVHKRVLDAQAQAKDVLAAAEADAAQIREQANALLQEVDGIREQAREAGYAAGKDAAAADLSAQVLAVQQLKEAFYANAEPEIVKLVSAIAEKVIGQLTAEHQDVVVAVVKQAVTAALGDRIKVRVNPEDYEAVIAAQPELQAGLDRTQTVHISRDAEVKRGGCLVETEIGTIDANLDGQLAAIRKALKL